MVEMTLTFTQAGILRCALDKELEYWEDVLKDFDGPHKPFVRKEDVEDSIIAIKGMLRQMGVQV